MLDWSEYTKLLIGLLAIVNPVGAIPIYLGLTQCREGRDCQRIARTTTLAVAAILLTTLATGELLLALFGISLASFRVAGGILLLLMAVSMLHARDHGARSTVDEARESADRESVAVVPLAIPLLAGPGAISTVIVYAERGNSAVHYLCIGGIILLVSAAVLTALRTAPALHHVIGQTGMNIITRLMGLITAAIAVEIMSAGLIGLFPALRPNG